MPTDRTIAVLSGKGGTGKTLVSVNLAAVADQATYIDCDVEEPNGHLFLKPSSVSEQVITVGKPEVDQKLCDGCRICSKACAFNALAVIGKQLLIFEEICHSCGLCMSLCPQHALKEVQKPLGVVRKGSSGSISFLSAEMRIGESSAVPLIKALMREKQTGLTILDSPPGSGCLVTETISHADFCLLVAEPTKFGAHNLAMVHELVMLMDKPCAVLLNKTQDGENPSEVYAKTHNVRILGSLPYDKELAHLTSEALVASRENEHYRSYFSSLLQEVKDASDSYPQR
ncbi:MAG TPA: ATPase [Sphaerochaeta sp.]|nr:ATPase [Sphaerochaeta sp.]